MFSVKTKTALERKKYGSWESNKDYKAVLK
jgi:hypothetical protein